LTPASTGRFLARVGRSNSSDCWPWLGCKDRWGYGLVSDRRTCNLAHRAAYEHFVGPIPAGLCVLHRCDNPACVNPSHLWVGTVADNNLDMVSKGRHRFGIETALQPGEKHYAARLKVADILEIRRRSAAGESRIALAAVFGVHPTHIKDIDLRRKWKCVA